MLGALRPRDASDDRGQLGTFMVLVVAAIALVVVTVVLLLGMSVVGGVVEGLGGNDQPYDTSAGVSPTVGEAATFEDTAGEAAITDLYAVKDSRGYGVALTGAPDSYVASDADIDIADGGDEWTIATWARVDSDATNETMTAISADGRVLLQYNGTADHWAAWYYDDGSRNSYRVTVDAPAPEQYSWIAATHNGSTLTIYHNTTQGEQIDTSTASIEPARTNSSNWQGRLDETRTFAEAVNSTQRSTLVDDPTAPLPDANRTARIMYDQGQGSTTPIYFAGTQATLSNASWVGGLSGTTLDEGTDYEIDVGAGTITALADGRIDGAPVVFIDYRYAPRDAVGDLGQTLGDSFGLLGTSVIVLPAIATLAVLVGGLVLGMRSRVGDSDAGDQYRGR